jgi:hypothetical protein
MRILLLISLLMMSIHTIGQTETATTGNLLPNAGTGQTSVQHSNSTIDGINSSTGWTLNNVTDFTQYNELEANGTGTVSATGSLLNITTEKETGGDFTTTEDSLDGGVTLTSKTEIQNCEWVGSAYQCGQATSGQDSYSTTVTILDENDQELATVTQNRNKDSGYYDNTHTYTDTITYTGEGARKWDWEWTGIDGNDPNSTAAVGPNLLGAELKAILLDIFYSPLPPAIKDEIDDVFEDIGEEFEEIEQIVEEFFFEEEKIEMEEEMKMEESFTIAMKEEEKFEEEPIFEEFVMIEEEEKEEEEPVMQMIETFTEEEEAPKEEKTLSEMLQEGFKEEQEDDEEEPDSETTETADATEEDSGEQKEVQQKETKTVGLTEVLDKIDEKIKDIDKNLQLKNLVKLKVMSGENILDAYNIPFYEPKDIYLDQVEIADNRVIYEVDLVEYKQNDPINKKNQELNSILQKRQKLIQELQVLQNEL